MADVDILYRAEFDASGALREAENLKRAVSELGPQAQQTSTHVRGLARASEVLGNTSRTAEKNVESMGTSLGRLALAASGVIALAKLPGILRNLGEIALEAAASQARLEAVLKATGGAAGYTAAELSLYARDLHLATGASIADIKDAMAVLSTFRSVSGTVFADAIKLAIDMSAVFGHDLRQAAIMVGKALDNPIVGLTALRRIGVTFRHDQEELIKTFIKQGDLYAAHREILHALEIQVGGAAKAVHEASERFEFLHDSITEVKKALGSLVVTAADTWAHLLKLKDISMGLVTVFRQLAGTYQETNYLDNLTAKSVAALIQQKQKQMQQIRDEMLQLDRTSTKYAELRTRLAELIVETKNLQRVLAEKQEQEAKVTAIQNEFVKSLQQEIKETEKAAVAHLKLGKAYEALSEFKVGALELKNEFKALPQFVQQAFEAFEGIEQYMLPPASEWQPYVDEFGQQLAKALGTAIAGGIIDVLASEDFKKSFESVWQVLSFSAQQRLGTALSVLFEGGTSTEALTKAGFITPAGETNWKAIASTIGAMVMSYGIQRQNRTAGVVGGMVSGAVAGFSTTGTPIGAIIGAIIGGIAGYFASSAQKFGFKFQYGGGKPALLDVTGPTEMQEREMLRQFHTQVLAYRTAFLEIFDLLGGVPREALEKLAAFQVEFRGEVTDVSATWRQILTGELPRAMLAQVQPALQASLQAIGVSSERASQQLAALTTGDFQVELQKFAAWVSAIVDLGKMSELLGQDWTQLREINRQTMREAFLGGFEDVMARARELTTDLDLLFSEDQVARAEELLQLSREQYQETLRYIAQIDNISQGIQKSTQDIFLDFREQRAREAGPLALAAFYQEQMLRLRQAIASATSPEQVQSAWQDFLQYAQKLWGLEIQGEPIYRNWVETTISEAERLAQSLLVQWQQEAAERQQQLKNEIDAMRDALTKSATTMQETTDKSSKAINEETEHRERLKKLLEEEITAREKSIDSLQKLADKIDELGGMVAIHVLLDEGLAGEVYGDTELIRLSRGAA